MEKLESKDDDKEVLRDDTETLRHDFEYEMRNKCKVVDLASSQEPESTKETKSKYETKLTEEVYMETKLTQSTIV